MLSPDDGEPLETQLVQAVLNDLAAPVAAAAAGSPSAAFCELLPGLRSRLDAVHERAVREADAIKCLAETLKALLDHSASYIAHERAYGAALGNLSSVLLTESGSRVAVGLHNLSVVNADMANEREATCKQLSNSLLYPLKVFTKQESLAELRKQYDRDLKHYDNVRSRMDALERGANAAEGLADAKRAVQLSALEYLVRLNRRRHAAADLGRCIIDARRAIVSYCTQGMAAIGQLSAIFNSAYDELDSMRSSHNENVAHLESALDKLRSAMPAGAVRATASTDSVRHGNVASLASATAVAKRGGSTQKRGWLEKQGSQILRTTWKRRYCVVDNGLLLLSKTVGDKNATKVELLTSMVKEDETADPCIFTVISKDRSCRLKAASAGEAAAWVTVLRNNIRSLLEGTQVSAHADLCEEEARPALQQQLEQQVQIHWKMAVQLPGNELCCDCGDDQPDWWSSNLGILLCWKCYSAHGSLGMSVSRIASTTLGRILPTDVLVRDRAAPDRGLC